MVWRDDLAKGPGGKEYTQKYMIEMVLPARLPSSMSPKILCAHSSSLSLLRWHLPNQEHMLLRAPVSLRALNSMKGRDGRGIHPYRACRYQCINKRLSLCLHVQVFPSIWAFLKEQGGKLGLDVEGLAFPQWSEEVAPSSASVGLAYHASKSWPVGLRLISVNFRADLESIYFTPWSDKVCFDKRASPNRRWRHPHPAVSPHCRAAK